jgi:hypothetical protein
MTVREATRFGLGFSAMAVFSGAGVARLLGDRLPDAVYLGATVLSLVFFGGALFPPERPWRPAPPR